MIEDVKESVQALLTSFTAGDCDAETLQQRLLSAGVQVALKPDDLERLRANPESACVTFPSGPHRLCRLRGMNDFVCAVLKALWLAEISAVSCRHDYALASRSIPLHGYDGQGRARACSYACRKSLEAIVGREFTAQLPFVLDDHDRIKNFMGIAHALRANGESAPSAAPALLRSDSGQLSTASSDADVAKAKSLGVQSQSSTTSSVMGLLDRFSFGSRAASEKAHKLDSDRLLANSVAAAAEHACAPLVTCSDAGSLLATRAIAHLTSVLASDMDGALRN